MSIVKYDPELDQASTLDFNVDKDKNITDAQSLYTPTPEELDRVQEIIRAFTLGYMNMYKPRREWNDMCTLDRMTIDQMSFNTYQPNNGQPAEADLMQSWKSRAIRPIVRNKIISIGAHATARLIFPKIFAVDEDSDEQKDAAMVMEDLMEWAGDQSNYAQTSMTAVLTALWSPASIVFTGYDEIYRTIKGEKKEDGTYTTKQIIDETLSGFHDTIVPVDELYIENFYENDIQKQSWIIWRKVISFDLARSKYSKSKNWGCVKPGVQTIYSDANSTFYEVYDSNMRQYDVEEIIYYNRSEDLMCITVNGILMNDPNNPLPRNDKKYPMAKFGYELMDEGKCFYYKSLAFKLDPDARIINTLYPMIIDGTYLNIMPPMIVNGGEAIGSDVVVPGAITTLSDPEASLTPINPATNIQMGMSVLEKVEGSGDESSQDPVTAGLQDTGSGTTAYEISRIEQNSATVLGLFIKMISSFVKDYGELRLSDILQYLTIADVEEIEDGNPKLVYKTFLMPDRQTDSGTKSRKIMFDNTMPSDPISGIEEEDMSFDLMEEEEKGGSNVQLFRVNPPLFRNLKFYTKISPDVMNPMSESLERAYLLEEYDRAIQNPLLDQDQVTRDFLLSAYPKSRKDPERYMVKNQPMPSPQVQIPQIQGQSPVAAAGGEEQLTQTPSVGALSGNQA